MGKAYSSDLRDRIADHIASGQSRRSASRHFGVSPSCAVKLARRVTATGSAKPARQGRPPGDGKLAPHMATPAKWVDAEPDITVPELSAWLAAATDVRAHPASLSLVLLKAGYSFKKTLLASECGRDDIAEARRAWRVYRQPNLLKQPCRLVFIDETATTTRMTRLRGRARRDQRLKARAPFGHWKTQTFIAALRCDGLCGARRYIMHAGRHRGQLFQTPERANRILPDGQTAGSLSAGCLERQLATDSLETRARGVRSRVLRYGRGSHLIDFRLPCGSGLDILIDSAPNCPALQSAVNVLDRRREAIAPLPLPPGINDALLTRRRYIPRLRLILFGEGPEYHALAILSHAMGIELDRHRPATAQRQGLTLGQRPTDRIVDPWTAIVLLFHNHEWDRALLRWAVTTSAFSSARRAAQRRLSLLAKGVEEAAIGRLLDPIGLFPQARSGRPGLVDPSRDRQ